MKDSLPAEFTYNIGCLVTSKVLFWGTVLFDSYFDCLYDYILYILLETSVRLALVVCTALKGTSLFELKHLKTVIYADNWNKSLINLYFLGKIIIATSMVERRCNRSAEERLSKVRLELLRNQACGGFDKYVRPLCLQSTEHQQCDSQKKLFHPGKWD